MSFDRTGESQACHQGNLRRSRQLHPRPENHRRVQAHTCRREEAPAKSPPSPALTLRDDHFALRRSGARELHGMSIGRIDLLEMVNDPPDPLCAEPCQDLHRKKPVGSRCQPVALRIPARDPIALRLQGPYVLPHRRSGHSELAREARTRKRLFRLTEQLQQAVGRARLAQGGSPVGTISSARSTEGAECVSAPTEIQSTPVAATSEIRSSVMPPEASRGRGPRNAERLRPYRRSTCCRAGSRRPPPREPRQPGRASRTRSRPAAGVAHLSVLAR